MMKKITIRVTDQEYAKLMHQAEENRVSVTGLCRLLVVSGDADILGTRRITRAAVQIRKLLSQCNTDSETKRALYKELDSLCHT